MWVVWAFALIVKSYILWLTTPKVSKQIVYQKYFRWGEWIYHKCVCSWCFRKLVNNYIVDTCSLCIESQSVQAELMDWLLSFSKWLVCAMAVWASVYPTFFSFPSKLILWCCWLLTSVDLVLGFLQSACVVSMLFRVVAMDGSVCQFCCGALFSFFLSWWTCGTQEDIL